LSIEAKLKAMGHDLPPAPNPAANYVPFVREGNLLFIAGQIPWGADGKLHHVGKVGREIDEASAYQAARMCGLNALAQAKQALGSLDLIRRVVRVGGFVNAAEDFTGHPKVINGVSDLLGELFGEQGRHARASVGCSSLPLGAAVEVDMILAVKSD